MKIVKLNANAPREINVSDFREVRNVLMSFKVTEEQLRAAVAEVGTGYEDVRNYLGAFHNPYLHRKESGRWRL